MQTTGSFLMTPLILMKIFTLPFKLFCQVVHSFSDYFVQVSLVNNPAMSRLTHTAICVTMVTWHCLLFGAYVPPATAGPADDLSRTGHRARRAIYGHHGFSNEDIRVIMEVHNGRRGQVSPTASNMKYMVSIMGGVGLYIITFIFDRCLWWHLSHIIVIQIIQQYFDKMIKFSKGETIIEVHKGRRGQFSPTAGNTMYIW